MRGEATAGFPFLSKVMLSTYYPRQVLLFKLSCCLCVCLNSCFGEGFVGGSASSLLSRSRNARVSSCARSSTSAMVRPNASSKRMRVPAANGCGSKLNHQGTADLSPWFHLPGFYFGYPFLTHSQMAIMPGMGEYVLPPFAVPGFPVFSLLAMSNIAF